MLVKYLKAIDFGYKRIHPHVTIPVCRVLNRFHVRPSYITIIRIGLLLGFFLGWINNHYILSVLLLVIYGFFDIIDGELARLIGTDSDLRKFQDLMADNLMVVILPLALILHEQVSGFFGAYYIFIATLSWWLSVLKLNDPKESNWIIRAQASTLLHLLRFWIIPISIFLYAFFRIEIFSEIMIILSTILTTNSLYDYCMLIRIKT